MAEQQAERAVLGSMIRANVTIPDVMRIVSKTDFCSPAHRMIFEAIVDLTTVEGTPADAVTVANKLHSRNQIDDIGGHSYLVDLWESSPNPTYAEHYATAVREESILRDLQRVGDQIARDARDRIDLPENMVVEAAKKINGIGTVKAADVYSVEQEYDAMIEALLARRLREPEKSEGGVGSGYPELDEITGGFRKQEVTIVAARPSVGKTALGVNVFYNLSLQKIKTFFVSLEQRKGEILERVLCIDAEVSSQRLRFPNNLNDFEVEKIRAARDRRFVQGLIIDKPHLRVAEIVAETQRRKVRDGIELVIIDYLQIVEPDNKRDPRHEQVATISRKIKQLARSLDIPVIALAQLNRNTDGRRPRLADLRESGGIEADADTVILLHDPCSEDDKKAAKSPLELIVAKHRNGPTGQVGLNFEREFMKFKTVELLGI